MARKKPDAAAPSLTAPRAARLYKLLSLLAAGPQTRRTLLTKLKLDVRGFYRDLETVRDLGIEVALAADAKYALAGSMDDALGRVPFPDPGLSVREAMQLAAGGSPAHRKLKQRINAFLNPSSKSR
ncbi:MAG: hypothetical protein K2P78_09920 [Gemmataceae bacterium]|nr:hypothetical protein [Gemmataceae bacterium]